MKIIIPFKETSVRCPNKNFILFPYTRKWLENQAILDQDIYVVSTSNKVKNFVFKYNVNFLYEKMCKNPNDIVATANAAIELGIDQYIFLPATQPIRNPNLIQNVANELQDKDCDFVTTYQTITDRSLFYIDDNMKFIQPSKNRKGCMCSQVKMLDGAIYGIKTEFAKTILNEDDINAAFWAGNFKAIENKVDFFIDIDTENDMKKFQLLSSASCNRC